jgi:hypothetical protein
MKELSVEEKAILIGTLILSISMHKPNLTKCNARMSFLPHRKILPVHHSRFTLFLDGMLGLQERLNRSGRKQCAERHEDPTRT